MKRRSLRLLLTAFVAVGALFAFASPAAAEARGQILDVQEDKDGNIRVVFVAAGVDEGTTLDVKSIQATLDGQRLKVDAAKAGEVTGGVRRVAVLAVDVSGTMRGAGLAGAKSAASVFLDQAPPDVLIGLVSFNDKVTVRTKPTPDRALIRRQIRSLRAGGGTALNDAIVRAVGVTGTEGVRSVVVLSDGETDNASRSSRRAAVARITGGKVKVDAIALETSASEVATLRALTKAGRGELVSAPSPAALADLFAEAAKKLENQLALTVTVPDKLAGRPGNLTISGTAAGKLLTDTAFVRTTPRDAKAAAPAPAKRVNSGPKVVEPSPFAHLVDKRTLPIAVGAVFVGLLFLLVVAVNASTPGTGGNPRVARRLDMYTLTGSSGPKQKEVATSQVLGDGAVARSAMDLAGRVVAKRGMEEKLARRLEAGGIPLKPAEWVLVHAAAVIVPGLLLFLLFGGSWIWALVGLFTGGFFAYAFLIVKEARRKKAFLSQLPDSLQLLSGSLSAGYSLPQAVDTIVREGQQPLAAEFNRVLVEARLGATIEDGMEGVAERMASPDFTWVVMAIRIQREVGGNLAEVLNTVAATLREREFLRRHVKALSAEGVISAWILCGLPPGFVLFLAVARPEYLQPLITDFFGLVLLGMSGILMAVGIVWMRKVIKVEI